MPAVNYNYTIKTFPVKHGQQVISIPKAAFILGLLWDNELKAAVMGDWDRPLVERTLTVYREGERLAPHHNVANYKGLENMAMGFTYFLFVD